LQIVGRRREQKQKKARSIFFCARTEEALADFHVPLPEKICYH
jgi:hypothetical protein